jgi:ribosomal protein L22
VTKPGDPQKGKAAEAEQAEQESKDSTEAVAKQAAADKGDDKPAKKAPAKKPAAKKAAPKKAEAAAEDKPKSTRSRAKKADDDDAAEAKPAEAKKPAAEKKAPAEKKPAAKKAPAKREAAKPARRRSRTPGEAVVVRAPARYVRSSARKARLVCDHIRGKDVATARAILAYSPRSISEAWIKLLESAVANAENNHDLDGDDLRIVHVYADEGPTIKRFRPRAMGRATKILKRTSHLSIALTPKDERN